MVEKKCKQCTKKLQGRNQKIFCSNSCSAVYNNTGKEKRKPKKCLVCGVLFKSRHASQIVCSRKCMGERVSLRCREDFMAGRRAGYSGKNQRLAKWLRQYIKNERGTQCSRCGWDGKHPIDGLSLTEINHIDGNASNCALENLEVLCPNCHSMTHNFRSRNKKSTRIRT